MNFIAFHQFSTEIRARLCRKKNNFRKQKIENNFRKQKFETKKPKTKKKSKFQFGISNFKFCFRKIENNFQKKIENKVSNFKFGKKSNYLLTDPKKVLNEIQSVEFRLISSLDTNTQKFDYSM